MFVEEYLGYPKSDFSKFNSVDECINYLTTMNISILKELLIGINSGGSQNENYWEIVLERRMLNNSL